MAFTEKELEELRRFNALIDASPMTYRDYIISDFIEDILFPELEKQRAELNCTPFVRQYDILDNKWGA